MFKSLASEKSSKCPLLLVQNSLRWHRALTIRVFSSHSHFPVPRTLCLNCSQLLAFSLEMPQTFVPLFMLFLCLFLPFLCSNGNNSTHPLNPAWCTRSKEFSLAQREGWTLPSVSGRQSLVSLLAWGGWSLKSWWVVVDCDSPDSI